MLAPMHASVSAETKHVLICLRAGEIKACILLLLPES